MKNEYIRVFLMTLEFSSIDQSAVAISFINTIEEIRKLTENHDLEVQII